ncbi:hypothetical protein BDQ17DRAFT_1239210 [Cyathus striatus]|nr:hypothetical protein BDQ17DRAFT_1239210 [Cyathus striatus]
MEQPATVPGLSHTTPASETHSASTSQHGEQQTSPPVIPPQTIPVEERADNPTPAPQGEPQDTPGAAPGAPGGSGDPDGSDDPDGHSHGGHRHSHHHSHTRSRTCSCSCSQSDINHETLNAILRLAESLSIRTLTSHIPQRKVKEPDTFDGASVTKLEPFILQCLLVFRNNETMYPTDYSRVNYAISYLWGMAMNLFALHISSGTTED